MGCSWKMYRGSRLAVRSSTLAVQHSTLAARRLTSRVARSPLHPIGYSADRKRLMPVRMLAFIAVAQFLGMTLWFSATAAAPAIAAEFALTGRGAAWLTMAVQAGFVAGTLLSAAFNLADVLNA